MMKQKLSLLLQVECKHIRLPYMHYVNIYVYLALAYVNYYVYFCEVKNNRNIQGS
jgi:hypothetical protein